MADVAAYLNMMKKSPLPATIVKDVDYNDINKFVG